MSPTVQENVFTCFDISSGKFMAVWAAFSTPDYPYYSIYDPVNGWSTPGQISDTSQADTNVIISQDTTTGAILATWLDVVSANQSPAYSIYNGTTWSPTAFISDSATSSSDDCFSLYDSSTGQFYASWVDSSNDPTYATSLISPNVIPSTPASFSGVQKIDGFIVVQEHYNVLTWQGNPTITSYNLFRNNVLIAVLNGSSTSYIDHNQPRKNQLYSLVAINAQGSSLPATTTVGAK